METDIILSCTAIFLFVFYFIYSLIKEKQKNSKETIIKEEQGNFYEKINKQFENNNIVNNEILKYLKISCQKYAEEITESQVRIVVDAVYTSSQHEIYNYIEKVSKENNIKGNEKDIIAKIKLFINNKFHKDYLIFKEFKYKESALSEYPINEWKDCLIENVLDNVIKSKGEKVLYSTLQNSFDNLKCSILDAVLS